MSEESSEARGYTEVILEVPRTAADAVCNFIIDNICSGLVLEEEEGEPGTVIRFYVPEAESERHEAELREYLSCLVGDLLPETPRIVSRPSQSRDWEKQYRDSVKRVQVAGDVLIRPPWDTGPSDAKYEIVIEPKMAFGTGRHETTRSCLQVIRERFQEGTRFLDLGCGSGILSILADKMGASYIKAVDYDVTAVENCRENLRINNVSADHDVLFGSAEKCSGDAQYGFVCVNIIRKTIQQLLPDLVNLVAPGGVLLLSGLLTKDEEVISAQLTALGQTRFHILRDNEWSTYTVERA